MIRWMLDRLGYCLRCWEKGRLNKMYFAFIQYPHKQFFRCLFCNHYNWR